MTAYFIPAEPLMRPVGVDPETGRKQWRLEEALTLRLNGTVEFTVPKGYVTDLASVPWFFRGIIPSSGDHDLAAIVHDYLCDTNKFSRFFGDAVFREAMRLLGVPLWKRVPMYYCVRVYAVCTGRW